MNEKRTITFIINPISGTHSKDEIPQMIADTLNEGLFDYQIRMTEYAGHAAEIAREEAEKGTTIVAAVGGDGTVNLPMDTKKAIAMINACKIETFDYGVINEMPFFCTCGMGFDAFISLKFAEAGKRGPVTYAENVLKEGLKYKPETYEVSDESGTHEYKAFLIACANASQYGNNAYIAPGATMKDGEMDVIVMEPFDVLDAPQIAADLFMKTLGNNSKIKTFRTKKLHIHRQEPGAIHYDGDPIMTDADIDVHIEHNGIRIVTNPEAIEDASQPNPVLNAFSDLFNNINNVREDIEKRGKRIQRVNKVLLRKLTKL